MTETTGPDELPVLLRFFLAEQPEWLPDIWVQPDRAGGCEVRATHAEAWYAFANWLMLRGHMSERSWAECVGRIAQLEIDCPEFRWPRDGGPTR